jgi:hypothetical protein
MVNFRISQLVNLSHETLSYIASSLITIEPLTYHAAIHYSEFQLLAGNASKVVAKRFQFNIDKNTDILYLK